MARIAIQEAPFDVGAEIAQAASGADGGIGCFVGVVRGGGDGPDAVEALWLEHYPGMTEASLAAIAEEAERRFSLGACTVIHRVGTLRAGEPIVLVVASAPHRAAALDATRFLIDWLKTKAPFWKREHCRDGRSRWIEARPEDEAAASAWDFRG